MKITIMKPVEIEVQFPIYKKNMSSMYKITDANNGMAIHNWQDGSFQVDKGLGKSTIDRAISEYEDAKEEDWNKAVEIFSSRCSLFISENSILC